MFAYSFGKSNATATRDVLSEIEQIARKQWLMKKNLCLVVYIASNVSNGAFFLRLYDYISFNLFARTKTLYSSDEIRSRWSIPPVGSHREPPWQVARVGRSL